MMYADLHGEEGSMDDLEALCMGCPVNKLVELVVYDENR